jgi:glycosyltransferase involved in cell wall biosynthesis
LTESLTFVLPVFNQAEQLDAALERWNGTLKSLGIRYSIVIVDDGSSDTTHTIAEQFASKSPAADIRVLRHESRQGFGACLRTALPHCQHELIAYSSLDYPYHPTDLERLLERISHVDEVYLRKLEVVSGCRTGLPVPLFWKLTGKVTRFFSRIVLGFPMQPLPGWLGFREHFRGWLAWLLCGVPLNDVNSAMKVYRRSVLDKFPIQSSDDYVHAELISKATFLSCLMDELPLTPSSASIPVTHWGDFSKVFRDPIFHDLAKTKNHAAELPPLNPDEYAGKSRVEIAGIQAEN